MKIGVTCNYFNGGGGGGGMERQAQYVVEGLAERGLRVTVFAKKCKPGQASPDGLDGVVKISHPWLPNKLRDHFFSRAVDRERRERGLDLIISCNRIENADIVVSAGCRSDYLVGMGWKAGFFDRLHIEMERKQFGRARHVLAVSQAMRKDLVEKHGIPEERVRVLYPAIDRERFTPVDAGERERLRRRFGFAPGRKTFLFPSRNHVFKGLALVWDFFAKTDLPVDLVVAGDPAKEANNIRSLGYVSDMESLYRAADFTILASRYETFGMVAVESVLCGTPVLFSERAGSCEVIREPALYKIRYDDPGLLERTVRRALDLDREAAGDLARCIGYDCGRSHFVDELAALL